MPRELLSFVKTERFLPLLVRALFFNKPQGSLLVAENWGGINQLQTKLPLISLFSYNSHLETGGITDLLCKLIRQLWILDLSPVTTICFDKRMADMYCLFKWNFHVTKYEKFRTKFWKLETILNEQNFLISWCSFSKWQVHHLSLVSDGATSVHVSYLWFPGRGHIWSRAAGLTSIMVSEVTRIVVPFPPPRLWESDSNNGPPKPSQSWATSVHVSYSWFPGRCHILPRAAGLTSIMAWKVTQIMTPFWPPAFIRVWFK